MLEQLRQATITDTSKHHCLGMLLRLSFYLVRMCAPFRILQKHKRYAMPCFAFINAVMLYYASTLN